MARVKLVALVALLVGMPRRTVEIDEEFDADEADAAVLIGMGQARLKDDGGDDLPTIAELPETLMLLPAAEIREMQRLDPRVTAQKIYEKRLAQLEAEAAAAEAEQQAAAGDEHVDHGEGEE